MPTGYRQLFRFLDSPKKRGHGNSKKQMRVVASPNMGNTVHWRAGTPFVASRQRTVQHESLRQAEPFLQSLLHRERVRPGIMYAPAIPHFNLRRQYFAEIAAGTKRIEYRKRKAYWKTWLEGRKYDFIQFRNGYATKAPEMLVEYRGYRIRGKGMEKEFAIRLGRILKIKRWKP